MLGIPQWAIGVVVIILVIAGAVMMVRWLQPEFERPELKSREADLSDVRMRLGELDQLKQRISELEERVDFAERLLAQQREGQRLGPPQG